MTYAITKKFVSGVLEGMEHKELSGVKFIEGKQYGDYIVISCYPINDDTVVQIEATRPQKWGGGIAVCSGDYSYIKKVAKHWKNSGYYNFHTWVD